MIKFPFSLESGMMQWPSLQAPELEDLGSPLSSATMQCMVTKTGQF